MSYKSISTEKRFWKHVDRNGPNGCWVWSGSKLKDGYGRIWDWRGNKSVPILAHRFSWMIAHGPIPESLEVCHNCPGGDNPACVNPSHLFLGTHDDNMKDMVHKGTGRWRYGEDVNLSKLTWEKVAEIRKLREQGLTQQKIADRYGVSQVNIGKIVRMETWKPVHSPQS